jgi:hypothetical protein
LFLLLSIKGSFLLYLDLPQIFEAFPIKLIVKLDEVVDEKGALKPLVAEGFCS